MKISLIISILFLLTLSCVPGEKPDPALALVSVSILPQKYFIEQLAGERVLVNVMVPPGASPATYEPTVSQLSQLDKSDLYLKMGYLGFEQGWMDKIRSVNPSMSIVNIADGIKLIRGEDQNEKQGHKHHHGAVDPHLWMSARNAKIMARNIANALSSFLPDDSAHIFENLSLLINNLDSLDREIENILSGSEGKHFMIYHPALAYFARDYQLEQHSLEWEGKSPSPIHMKRLTDLGNKHHISTIFIQVEFDRKNAEVLSKEIGAEIVSLNPLDENWPGQMIYIATKLKETW